MNKKLCSICKINIRSLSSNSYCTPCCNKKMREFRKTHPLTKHQIKIMNAHSYAHVYLKRGKIIKEPCRNCGNINSQMHHPNYDKPLLIEWYCRPCHMALHATARPTSLEY